MHKASRIIIGHLINNKTYLLVTGNNKGWKQNSPLSKKVNQTFIQIPYKKFIDKLTYKAERAGIKVYLKEESYTSGTSFIDEEQPTKENYNKNRRIKRGLFESNTNKSINEDVNASYQIIKKVFPQISYLKHSKYICIRPMVLRYKRQDNAMGLFINPEFPYHYGKCL